MTVLLEDDQQDPVFELPNAVGDANWMTLGALPKSQAETDLAALVASFINNGGTIQQVETGVSSGSVWGSFVNRAGPVPFTEDQQKTYDDRKAKGVSLKEQRNRALCEKIRQLLDTDTTAKDMAVAVGCSSVKLQKLLVERFPLEPLAMKFITRGRDDKKLFLLQQVRDAVAQGLVGIGHVAEHLGTTTGILRKVCIEFGYQIPPAPTGQAARQRNGDATL